MTLFLTMYMRAPVVMGSCVFFFFKQKTAYEMLSGDWSSDVCSSDLVKQNVTLFYGEVPLGESVELLVLRKSFARQLLPDGKVGRATEHCYYEVCTTPALYDLVAALIRTNQAAALVSQRS